MDQAKSTASILAIVFALASIILTFTGHALFAMVSAVAGILLGVIGAVLAISPKTSGGIMSVSAVGISIFGIGFAVIGLVLAIIF